ncbi:MAG: RNA methyltransferase [Pelagibacteraceae bacterium]|nr:RNA methyltransferase [Pelagibacteraceae bacterium]|tara:strand:+ start:20936 stop:21649 length:714 start_codon:yes stop_codon:yes gene_type:complete
MGNIRLYYQDNITENTTSLLSKEHTHYVANVMRLKRGSNINFFNKNGEWLSEIVFLEKDRIEVKFLNKVKEPSKLSNIELAICLVKKSPMENILQKATELGVNKITPIISDRTEVKDLNYERAKKIVTEATEQSNQLIPPVISEITKLQDCLKNLDASTKLLFADVNSKDSLQTDDLKNSKSLCVLIGPEGDFSPLERKAILENLSVKSFTISRNILRSDTAVISAISLVNFINNSN